MSLNSQIVQTQINIQTVVDKDENVFINLEWGYPFFIDWYKTGEPNHKKWWWNNIKPELEWTMIDAGANVGIFSIIFGKKAKKVYAFEPTETIHSLEKNLLANNITNVEIINKALGYKDETKKDRIYHIWDGANPLNEIFEFVTIDTFVEERKEKIDAIKIDVDSYDYEVLMGARNVLLKQRPIVIVEVTDVALHLRQADSQKILSFMKDEMNYELKQILDGENYLFVPKK